MLNLQQLMPTPSILLLQCSPSLLFRLSNLLFLLHYPTMSVLLLAPSHPLFQCHPTFRNAILAHLHQHTYNAILLWLLLHMQRQHHLRACLLLLSTQFMIFRHPIPLSNMESSRVSIPAQQAHLPLLLLHPPPTTSIRLAPQLQWLVLSHHLNLHYLQILRLFLHVPV